MVIDWKCPLCNENHLTDINFESTNKKLSLFCHSCNKTNIFLIEDLVIYVNCSLNIQDNNHKKYTFSLFK